jgi:hypothetical protein
MSDATFIVDGDFSGDGTANAVAFASGPDGFGVLTTRASGTLASTGQGGVYPAPSGTSDPRTYEDEFQNGLLITEQNSGAFDEAFGAGFPIIWRWKWSGASFQMVGNNIVTARAATAPTATVAPMPSGAPPDGTYGADIAGASEVNAGTGVTDQVNLTLFPSCQFGGPSCVAPSVPTVPSAGYTFTVPAATDTIYPEVVGLADATQSLQYVTGPAWPIAGLAQDWENDGDGGITDPWGEPTSWDQRGATPWYIPTSLVLSGSSFLVGANVPVEVTFAGGSITNLFIYSPLG